MRLSFLAGSCIFPIFFLLLVGFGCQSSQPEETPPPLEDFGFNTDKEPSRFATEQYYSDLERSTAAVPFSSSFPVAFSVGGTRSSFEVIPNDAQSPLPSRLTIRMGECAFFLRTGPVQVRRFLYTGEWIKFGEEIQAQSVIKLEKHMDLNLKMASQLVVEIPKKHFEDCKQILYGRRTFIGRYHLYHSDIKLLEDAESKPASFERADLKQEGSKVYVYWHKDWKHPVLKNDLEFPATVESPIYRVQLSDHGFYYVGFQPVLRMQNVNRLVIQIPLPEQLQQLQQRQKQRLQPATLRESDRGDTLPPEPPLQKVKDSKS